MKNCPNCNALVDDNVNVCPECDTPITEAVRANKLNFTPKQISSLKTIALIFCVTAICEIFFDLPIHWKQKKKTYPAVTITEYHVEKLKNGEYDFIVNYDFTNTSTEPQSFALTVNDEVYYNGVQCSYSYMDYGGVDRHDKLASKKQENVIVGYRINDFKPDKKYIFKIQLTKLFDTEVFRYKEISSGIQIKEKE